VLSLLALSPVLNRRLLVCTVVRGIGIIIFVIGILTACVVQIEAGEAGVKVLFGKVQNDVLGSGWHFVNPLLDIRRLISGDAELYHERGELMREQKCR
jgi:regulator of protease activity HflC (stomatin/prohibitin superfamily)